MKKCPSCNYERTEQDNLHFPEYECPSCGVIDKYKARFEFKELEKKREKERKAKLAKIKKEQVRKRQEDEERQKKEEEERRKNEEADRLKKLAEEKLRLEEEERIRKEVEEKKAAGRHSKDQRKRPDAQVHHVDEGVGSGCSLIN